MTKKRQKDFARVQMKPGRLLSKRQNITATKFKSRKIVMPKEKLAKMRSQYTIKDCIQRLKSAGTPKDKIGHLYELNKIIHRQSDSVNAHLSLIFESMYDYMRDPHDGVRNNGLKVVVSVIEATDGLQLHSYVDLLSNYISALMKNPYQRVVSASLKLLDCMLKNHPDLICCNIFILYELLVNVKKHNTRKMHIEKEIYQYSVRGDINAFAFINAFLTSMLGNKHDKAQNDEGKDVYLDPERPLYLEIYAGGGLQPIDIEEAYSKQFGQQTNPYDEAELLRSFILKLLPMVPGYFCEIVASESNADDNTFIYGAISDLSILIQLLCSLTELAEKVSCFDEVEETIASFLRDRVFSSNRKRFPFDLHNVMPGTSILPLALLNTSLCFLYMKFFASNDNTGEDMELIGLYFEKFFTLEKTYTSDVKCNCIPIFVKMIQLCYYMKEVPKVINLLLKHLVLLLKTRINHPNKKILIDLLFNMSLHPGYKFWIDSEPMELWYEWLLSKLREENFHRLDKKLARMIVKVAKLRHSSFRKHLKFDLIKPLLKHSDNDLKEVAIFLLHNMEISEKLLKNIYDVIYQDSFPKKFTCQLIQMLHARFTQYPADEIGYINYIEFLLNVALDTYYISRRRMIDFEANQYTKALEPLKDNIKYNIFPSIHWKEHSQVFEACQMSLRNLPEITVCIIQTRFIKDLTMNRMSYPIHCALAIFKLDMPELTDKYYRLFMRDLNFSCLITTSVLTQMPMEEEWFKWNVSELVNSMHFTVRSASEFMYIVQNGLYGDPDGPFVYHILRVIKVFAEKDLFDLTSSASVERIISTLSTLVEEQCLDKNMRLQPLYIQLYNYFIKHYV